MWLPLLSLHLEIPADVDPFQALAFHIVLSSCQSLVSTGSSGANSCRPADPHRGWLCCNALNLFIYSCNTVRGFSWLYPIVFMVFLFWSLVGSSLFRDYIIFC